jgi:hypothetical protein
MPTSSDPPGFTAGVLHVSWTNGTDAAPTEIAGRPGRLFSAQIDGCVTRSEMLLRDMVNQALVGLVVRAPDGKLSRIAGVESFATMRLGTGPTGKIGVLLVPVDET